jgi:hypothetical protein
MNGKVEASLKQLSSFSKSLNEASDELSKQISAIESALNEFKLGVWVWVKKPILTETEFSEPDDAGNRREFNFNYELGYGKHKGKWGLLISYGWEGDDGMDTKITPLRDAPREIRIKAMGRIPDLLDELAQEMSSLTQEASKRAAEAKQLAAALNNKKSR